MLEKIISDLGDSCVAIHPRLVRPLRSLLKTGFFATRGVKKDSDLDLVIMSGTLNLEELLAIENEIDELLLPYKIDLSLYENFENIDYRIISIVLEKRSSLKRIPNWLP